MDIIKSLQWRYAVKKFDSSIIIEESKIELLCEAFNLTPTSYGLQPIKLLVVKNKELQKKIESISFNQKQVSTASHLFILCIEDSINTEFLKKFTAISKNTRPNSAKEIDGYAKVLNDRFKMKSNNEIKLWATKQAYIALGNLMTVCATEKIDTCPMEGFIPNKLDEILKLKEKNISSVLILPIGIRDKTDFTANQKKIRKPLKDIVERIF